MLSMLQIPIQSVVLSYNHQTLMFLLSAYPTFSDINYTEFLFKTGVKDRLRYVTVHDASQELGHQ